MQPTPDGMSLVRFLEQLLLSGVGATGLVAILLFLFRESLGSWIDKRIDAKVQPLASAHALTEARMSKMEASAGLAAGAMQHIAETIRDGMHRQTKAIETISETVTEQGRDISRIAGRLDAMSDGPR